MLAFGVVIASYCARVTRLMLRVDEVEATYTSDRASLVALAPFATCVDIFVSKLETFTFELRAGTVGELDGLLKSPVSCSLLFMALVASGVAPL